MSNLENLLNSVEWSVLKESFVLRYFKNSLPSYSTSLSAKNKLRNALKTYWHSMNIETPAYSVQSAFILWKIYANTDIRLSTTKVILNGFLPCPPHGYRPYIMGDLVAHAKRVPSSKPVINLRVRRCLSFEFYKCHQRKRWPNNLHVWSIGFCPVDFTPKFSENSF